MNDTSLSLDTQLHLQEVRLRVLNREPVSRDEYRALLLALREDRESASRGAAAAKRAERKASSSAKQTPVFDLNSLFGPKS